MAHAIAHHVSSRNAHVAPGHRLDGIRITAGAGAIAVNAAVLLLMLAPMAIPELRPELPATIEAVWIPRDPPKVDVIPVEVKYTPQATKPSPGPAARPQPVEAPRVEAQPGDRATTAASEDTTANTLAEGTTTEPTTGEVGIATGAVLQHRVAPPPVYPRKALIAGQTGTVILRVLVDVDGRPLEVSVAQSSGHRELDFAARRQVQSRWTFKPALQAGQAVQAIGLVPVEFKLD